MNIFFLSKITLLKGSSISIKVFILPTFYEGLKNIHPIMYLRGVLENYVFDWNSLYGDFGFYNSMYEDIKEFGAIICV